MKSIDTYLCKNSRKPFITHYDHRKSEAAFSDGSVKVISFTGKSSSDIYEMLKIENPKVQVISKLNDGYWPFRFLAACAFGCIIYMGASI